ncbi:MAG: hypothetical protein LAP40_10505 [Acidobacteriia bacterium]|nr:hypothetical protein [Terriglobia bacterium]
MKRSIEFFIVGAAVLAVLPLLTTPAAAQGPAGTGRETAPAGPPTPRLPDGKVDFGGKGVWAPIWVLDWADKKYVDQAVDVPFTAWALKLYQERRANDSKDDPEGYCLPPGVPRYTGTPYPFQFLQMKDRVVILYEGASHMYRQIFMDGRKHTPPDRINPTWLGESIGWWEGNDTLVVDTVGFNGRTWLDYVGHPASEDLHVVEKFRRPDSLTLKYEATIEDPKAYTKPWTTNFTVKFRPGWDLLEYVCLENNKDLGHIGTTQPK